MFVYLSSRKPSLKVVRWYSKSHKNFNFIPVKTVEVKGLQIIIQRVSFQRVIGFDC